MQLQEILYSQGFGTRRVCAGLVQQGFVQVYMENDPLAPVSIIDSATELVATAPGTIAGGRIQTIAPAMSASPTNA